MRNHIGLALGLSSLCVALAVPANATVSSRATNFPFTCDGTNKTVTLTFPGFTAGTTQNIIGGEIALFENRGALQYVILRVQGDPNKQLATVTLSDNRGQTMFPGEGIAPTSGPFVTATIPATIPVGGNLLVTIEGACGTGQTQGLATIWLLSNP